MVFMRLFTRPSTNYSLGLIKYLRPSVCSTSTKLFKNPNSMQSENDGFFDVDSLNPAIFNVHYAVRGPIVIRASELQLELSKVLSACVYPDLLKQNIFPPDVVLRATNILAALKGSVGCYTESIGTEYIRKSVAKYIESRDGYGADPNNIVLTNGASSAIKIILYSITKADEYGKVTGVMVPIPQYPLYSATLSELNGELISYFLNEKKNWSLDIEECERALCDSKKLCNPKAMVVINPGNPTGQVITYENMVDIIKFCLKYKLTLLADEVYQHNVYDKNVKFNSFKKVVRDLGLTENDFSLVSFNSISKGFYGECGIRGGYMELFGFKSQVKKQLYKLISASLCSSSCGQVVLETVVNPPKPGEESYEQYRLERDKILGDLKLKSEILYTELNSISGITCNKIQGALYAFPQLHLPEYFIEEAKKANMHPDEYYCFQLLEQTGVCLVPGSGFKQSPGSHHFRYDISTEILEQQSFRLSLRSKKWWSTYENSMKEYLK